MTNCQIIGEYSLKLLQISKCQDEEERGRALWSRTVPMNTIGIDSLRHQFDATYTRQWRLDTEGVKDPIAVVKQLSPFALFQAR
jgi:hypothetical protein